MGWRRTDRGTAGPPLLEVWAPPAPAAPPPPAAPSTQPPAAPSTPPPGALTCIRINCARQGRPTTVQRCPECGHGTQLLRDYRWPRPAA